MIFKIAVVGLGIIGASVAKALCGFKGGAVYGIDADKGVIDAALRDNVIVGEAKIEECDSVVLALYPKACVEFVRTHSAQFKSGAVIWDVCGVKGAVTSGIKEVLRRDLHFVGAHPMAGKEQSGYAASDKKLFCGCNFIITPEGASEAAVSLVREAALFMGAGNIVVTDCEKHDAMIAYTSQLMHSVAVALCRDSHISEAGGYSAGSLRDCTRVADINDALWSELFIDNAAALGECTKTLCENLTAISTMAQAGDREGLRAFLKGGADAKRKYLLEVKQNGLQK